MEFNGQRGAADVDAAIATFVDIHLLRAMGPVVLKLPFVCSDLRPFAVDSQRKNDVYSAFTFTEPKANGYLLMLGERCPRKPLP